MSIPQDIPADLEEMVRMSNVGTADVVVAFGAPGTEALGPAFADRIVRGQVEATLVHLVGEADGPVWVELLLAMTIMIHAAPALRDEWWDAVDEMAAWDHALVHPAGSDEQSRASMMDQAMRYVRENFVGFSRIAQQLPSYTELAELISSLVCNSILKVEDKKDVLGRYRNWVVPGQLFGSYAPG